jgi:hypothetical protein
MRQGNPKELLKKVFRFGVSILGKMMLVPPEIATHVMMAVILSKPLSL